MAQHEQFATNWDLGSYFPEFDGPEYRAHRDRLKERLEVLLESSQAIGPLVLETAPRWRDVVMESENIARDASHLSSYIGCLSAADAKNTDYKREQSRLASLMALYRKAAVPLTKALRDASDEEFQALASQPGLEDVRYYLEQSREDAKYSMEPELELLAADLSVDGIKGWGRLYDTLSGSLDFDLQKPDGSIERVPMAQKNTLLNDSNAAIRRAALEGSNKAWENHADTVAACLNGIGGTRLTLNRNRGVEHFLDVAMRQSSVSRETIECMWSVVAKNRDTAHDYLRHKAKLLGVEKLGFQDLTAPLPSQKEERYSWDVGCDMVLRAFDSRYPALADYTRVMLRNGRVESEKRTGKRPGAFCTSSFKIRESRVYMTYGGSISDMQTLAHEIGHAWHNEVMRDLRPLARMYPMTLAETASTFAEDILTRALLANPAVSDSMKAQLLDILLENAATFMLNIHMRYIFEERFYTERAEGEVSVPRLKELVLEAQRECYGVVLKDDELDPWFWASKLHFYITGVTFYNFPYTFGYLFSRGLSARFREEGPSFLENYERLLRLTGSASAEEVAKRSIGVDLRQPDFWENAMQSIREEVGEFLKVQRTA